MVRRVEGRNLVATWEGLRISFCLYFCILWRVRQIDKFQSSTCGDVNIMLPSVSHCFSLSRRKPHICERNSSTELDGEELHLLYVRFFFLKGYFHSLGYSGQEVLGEILVVLKNISKQDGMELWRKKPQNPAICCWRSFSKLDAMCWQRGADKQALQRLLWQCMEICLYARLTPCPEKISSGTFQRLISLCNWWL